MRTQFKRTFTTLVGIAAISAALCGCKFVDSSITDRISSLNNAYDVAGNNEILDNIIRASRFQPLRFYQHTKIAPSQTSDFKLGLPNFVFGPAKAAAAKEYLFSANTDNSASVSLELDPIETHDFHNTLLTPIPVGVLGLILQNFPKEMVFHTLLDSIRFIQSDGTVIEYKNEPVPATVGCPTPDYASYDPQNLGSNLSFVSPYHPPGVNSFSDLTNCRYQRFVYWVQTAILYGLSIEFASVPNPKYDPNDAKGTQPKTVLVGRFCLDPAQARPDLLPQLRHLPSALCEQQPKTGQVSTTAKATDEGTEIKLFPFTRDKQVINATLGIRPRSIMSTFLYLGKLLRSQNLVNMYTAVARSEGDSQLFTVVPVQQTADCFASSEANNICVPNKGADNTKRLFSLLSELVQLGSTTTDTPASLTVRLTP